jgi:hypothetical protein
MEEVALKVVGSVSPKHRDLKEFRLILGKKRSKEWKQKPNLFWTMTVFRG